jgi:hypothetical protein
MHAMVVSLDDSKAVKGDREERESVAGRRPALLDVAMAQTLLERGAGKISEAIALDPVFFFFFSYFITA